MGGARLHCAGGFISNQMMYINDQIIFLDGHMWNCAYSEFSGRMYENQSEVKHLSHSF